jgi:hypothetical protein
MPKSTTTTTVTLTKAAQAEHPRLLAGGVPPGTATSATRITGSRAGRELGQRRAGQALASAPAQPTGPAYAVTKLFMESGVPK